MKVEEEGVGDRYLKAAIVYRVEKGVGGGDRVSWIDLHDVRFSSNYCI